MRKERIVNFQNIGPGLTATLQLPIGPTYEKIKINLGGTLLITSIDSIIGKINGKPFFTTTGADLLAENLYEGRTNPTNLVLLDFTRKNGKSSATQAGATAQTSEELLTAIPSALLQTLTFEIALNPAAPAGSTMQAFAQLSDPTKNPVVLKNLYANYTWPSAGDNDIILPVGVASGMIYKKIYFHLSGAGSVSNVQVRNNQVIILEGAPSDLGGDQADYLKVAQANLLVIDWDLQGMREKWLNTALAQNVYVRLTTTGGSVSAKMYSSVVDSVTR